MVGCVTFDVISSRGRLPPAKISKAYILLWVIYYLPYISYLLLTGLEGEISNNLKGDISLGDFNLKGELCKNLKGVPI